MRKEGGVLCAWTDGCVCCVLLCCRDMYDGMSALSPMNAVVDRGIALHKMIR